MLTDSQMVNLSENKVSLELLQSVYGLNEEYYIKPYMYITETLGLTLNCTGQEYRHAVEMANDDDFCPANAGIEVIVDGILAFLYVDVLERCGLDIITYFSYRFNPDDNFKASLAKFEDLIKDARPTLYFLKVRYCPDDEWAIYESHGSGRGLL